MKKRRILLSLLVLGWIAGILLPLYSLRRLSPSFQAAFDWVFQTDASHVVMHSFLYAVLACIIAFMLNLHFSNRGQCPQPNGAPGGHALPQNQSDKVGTDRRAVRLLASVLAVIAAVAVSQEMIQMTCEHVKLGADEIFDFFVDLNGGMLGTMIFLKISRHMEKKPDQTGRLDKATASMAL